MTVRRGIRLPLLVLALAGGVASFLLLRPAPSRSAPAPTITLRAVATNPGPLRACPASGDCPLNGITQFMLYVTNRYPRTNFQGASLRSDVPNAFDISSVHETATVNGAPYVDSTFTPPPNATFHPWDGHWPSSVQCPSGPDSCTVAGNPAILPGEKTVALYAGWGHGNGEPDGKYVFTFTIQGTLNGTPLELTAHSRGIKMTR